MNISDKIAADLKQAMLGRDNKTADALKMLKTALQYEALKQTDKVLTEDAVQQVLQKEQKKRQDAADLYKQNGDQERASQELFEVEIIAQYLPEPLSADELEALIDETISRTSATTIQDMGKVIAEVKRLAAGRANGGEIASVVKQRLASL